MRVLTSFVVGSILTSEINTASAISFEILQGGVTKGFASAYSGTLTGAANYGLSGSEAHLTVGPSLLSETASLFLYYGSDGLSFTIVFSDTANGSPDPGDADWNITVTGSSASVKLQDDNTELTAQAGGVFRGRWSWNQNLTDGGVLGSLQGDWQIEIDLNAAPSARGDDSLPGGIKVYSADGSQIALVSNGENIVLRAVPEGGTTFALLGSGLIGVALLRRRNA